MSITRPPIGPIDLHKLYPPTRDGTLTAYFRADDRWSNLVAVKLNQLAGAAGGGGIPEAPSDGSAYGRLNGGWAKVLPLAGGTLTGPLILAADPTTALGAATKQYVDGLIPIVPGASSTLPLMDGTAAIGTSTTWARADHIHPSDTSRAPLASPTFTGTPAAPTATPGTNTTQLASTAFVTAAITALAAIPAPSSTTPLMDGTAAIGTGTTYARADHVHPSDTSRLALAGGTMAGAIAMGSNKITGLANGTAAADGAAFGQIPLASATLPLVDGTAAVGTATTWARADHVHPTSAGGGTITGVTAGTGLTGGGTSGTVTVSVASAGITNALLATMPANTLKGNNTGATAAPVDLTVAQVMTLLAAAPLASPTFTGTPAAPTAAVNTNTTQLATTAFVLGQASSTTPAMNGTAAVGTGTTWARGDHVHPTDTSRAPLASPAFTGTMTLGGQAVAQYGSNVNGSYLRIGAVTIQWGVYTSASLTAGSAVGAAVTFPVAFGSSTLISAQALIAWTTGRDLVYWNGGNATTGNFVIYPQDVAGARSVYWQVVGLT